MTERWQPIDGFEGLYSISDTGRVRSDRRGRVIASVLTYDRYRTVKLYRDGDYTRCRISRLVARAFDPRSENPLHCHVAHLDGNKENNRAENLKWVSRTENESHKRIHGRVACGERNGRTRLTTSQVAEMRVRYASGVSGPVLGTDYGICAAQAWRIASSRAWRSDESSGGEANRTDNPVITPCNQTTP